MNLDPIRRNRLGNFLLDRAYRIKEEAKRIFFLKIMRHCPIISMRGQAIYKQGLFDLINSLSESDITMVEIGSYRGESAELFLQTGKVKTIYCVDPWKPFYDRTDLAAFTDMESVEKDFDMRFLNNPHVVKCKGTIDDFIAHFCKNKPLQVDFVYIDGCHTKEATQHDIEQTLSRIRPTIAIAGHDYGAGVKAAVNEMWGEADKVFSDSSWIHFLNTASNVRPIES